MWENILDLLPSLILIIVCLNCLLIATGLKYSIKKTLCIVIPFLIVLISINGILFYPKGNIVFDDWSIISVFIPEFILAILIGKRKGISSIVAIIDAYVAFYILILLKNVLNTYFSNNYASYILYILFIPLLIVYLKKFYLNFHDKIEEYMPGFLTLIGGFSLFVLLEFYVYRMLISSTNLHVLRLEIFGVAVISIYLVSIFIFNTVLNHFIEINEKANEKELIQKQLESIQEQYKIRDEKENELRVLRHDLKHVLTTVASLISQNKINDAMQIINEQVETVENNRITKYCKDPVINSVICYYKELCLENKINLKIKIHNIDGALYIKGSDIGILLSNLFDNAINATKKLKNNRRIEVKFVNTDGRLILQFKNNYDGEIEFDRNDMPTSFKEGHGIGTVSIASFVKKYNLNLDYEINNNVFIVSILF